MPEPINTFGNPHSIPPPPPAKASPLPPPAPKPKSGKLFMNLKSDDLILIGVILILMINECDDKLLILALIYVFLSDYKS
jgi:hypothetical protein